MLVLVVEVINQRLEEGDHVVLVILLAVIRGHEDPTQSHVLQVGQLVAHCLLLVSVRLRVESCKFC